MDNIKEIISKKHNNDREQLEFIFSMDKRIIVQAPAGCGKTTAMVSKIAWEISNGNIPPHKRILALTFSIPAATKIKNSVQELLPKIIKTDGLIINRIDVSNYHNFATKLLYKHGCVLHRAFCDFESFNIVKENDNILNTYLTSSEIELMMEFDKKVKSMNYSEVDSTFSNYYDILYNKLFNNKIITFNGLLLCAIYILEQNTIKHFYQNYYKMIIIDEFQDTNYLAFKFINKLIDKNNLYLLGDNVQKIYGFMGAIDNIFSEYEKYFHMKRIVFKNNYRFKDEHNLHQLDLLFREYATKYSNNTLTAKLNCKIFSDEKLEAKFILTGVKKIVSQNLGRVAVLVRAGYQADSIVKIFDDNQIAYFYAIFKEDDETYIDIHKISLQILEEISNNNQVTKSALNNFYKSVRKRINEAKNKNYNINIVNSLIKLLKIMVNNAIIFCDSAQARFEYISTVLSNNNLKHMLEYVQEKITITTIHSSKGLEWDYVIIPKIIQGQFPSYNDTCKYCVNHINKYNSGCEYCINSLDEVNRKNFVNELNVFYVGITRAKKNVFVTSNTGKNKFNYPQKTGCFLELDGVVCVDFDWDTEL